MGVKVWQGIAISLSLGAIAVYYLIYRNGRVNFTNINLLWLSLAIIMVILWWIANALTAMTISDALGLNLKIIDSIKLVLAGFSSGSITFFSSGTIPGEMAFLVAKNVPMDYALALTSIKTMMSSISKGILALVLASSMYNLVGSLISKILLMLFITYGLGVGGGYLVLFSKTRYAFRLRYYIRKGLDWIGKKLKRTSHITDILGKALSNQPEKMEPFKKISLWLPKYIFYTILLWGFQFSSPFFILKSLSIDTGIFQVMKIQGIFYIIQQYLPTPGGSGIAEISYKFFYEKLVRDIPIEFIILWRGLTFYLPTIIGGILVSPQISDYIYRRRKI
jgi:uncharacterized protein (TIRG00374 family)